MRKEYKGYMFLRESFIQSLLSDLTNFGIMCASFYFNENYVGGSYFFNAIIFIMMAMFLYSRATTKIVHFENKKDLLDYINKNLLD
jgi:hypothetical protein